MAFEGVLDGVRRGAVVGAAVVSRDGTVLTADLPEGVSRETFSIMCATIHGAGMTVSSQVRRSTPRRIILDSDEGGIVIVEAGRRALLALILAAGASADEAVRGAKVAIDRIVAETG